MIFHDDFLTKFPNWLFGGVIEVVSLFRLMILIAKFRILLTLFSPSDKRFSRVV